MSSVKKPRPRRQPPPLPERDVKPINWTWTFIPAAWAVLLCAAFATYWNSFEGKLFFDDLSSVRGNPHVSRRYSLEQAPLALRDMLDRKVVGKIVIEP